MDYEEMDPVSLDHLLAKVFFASALNCLSFLISFG